MPLLAVNRVGTKLAETTGAAAAVPAQKAVDPNAVVAAGAAANPIIKFLDVLLLYILNQVM